MKRLLVRPEESLPFNANATCYLESTLFYPFLKKFSQYAAKGSMVCFIYVNECEIFKK